ncbi:MAG: hypothetical protein WDM90_00840 [Ferruginibacter sp.]
MTNSNISLNFLELSPKEFDIIFYWKKLDLIDEEEKKNFYIKNIKINDYDEKATKVAIKFEPFNDFILKSVSQSFNIDITKQYLFFLVSKLFQDSDKLKTKRDKYNRIYLILKAHTEGVETVWIEPYYLAKSNSFGIYLIINFLLMKIIKRVFPAQLIETYFNYQETLDRTGKSNKEFYIFKYEKIKLFLGKYYNQFNQFIATTNLRFQINHLNYHRFY